MSEFIKTLFEEKEKLDEICHIEEQQRKKIQKHLDTLTDDQIKEMSFEDKVLLKEKYGFFIDTKLVNLLRELPLPCGTVVSMEVASDNRNNYSFLTRGFWLFVPIRAYSLMPLSL